MTPPAGSPRDPVGYRFDLAEQGALPQLMTCIAYCCREWVMAIGYRWGTCGYCGEVPTYLREDEGK